MQRQSRQDSVPPLNTEAPLFAPRSPGAIAIRGATEADLPAIARIVAEGWRQAYADILPPTDLDLYSSLDRREAKIRAAWEREDRILIATDAEGHVSGTVAEHNPSRLAGFDIELDNLYVRPDVVGGGIGRALVTALVQAFLQSGHRSMSVHTFEANTAGRRFYERQDGQYHSTDVWEGYACAWYTWDEAALQQLVQNAFAV